MPDALGHRALPVEGPAWTGKGMKESPGRYPLSVEGAVFRLVDQLLPGIITTTRHARMYSLHALAWVQAHERGLDQDRAAEFVRRCEVVMAAIHHLHQPHQVRLRSAHGEERIERFFGEAGLEVERAARPKGMSTEGFADVYLAPVVKVGLLSHQRPPRAGVRSDLAALRNGLGELCGLADRCVLPERELEAAGHLCLCSGSGASDGGLLRRVLFEDPEENRHEDRYRQLTCHMLLEAIGEERSTTSTPSSGSDGASDRCWSPPLPPEPTSAAAGGQRSSVTTPLAPGGPCGAGWSSSWRQRR